MGFKLKKALEKSYKQTVKTVGQTFSDPDRALMAILSGGQSIGAEAGIESLGAFGSEASKALYGEGAEAVLDLSAPDASSEEARRKKALEEAARLNSPGVRSQTVLNLR